MSGVGEPMISLMIWGSNIVDGVDGRKIKCNITVNRQK